MAYGWMLLALLLGLWSGLLFNLLFSRRERQALKQAGENRQQILDEWLYGEKTEMGG